MISLVFGIELSLGFGFGLLGGCEICVRCVVSDEVVFESVVGNSLFVDVGPARRFSVAVVSCVFNVFVAVAVVEEFRPL